MSTTSPEAGPRPEPETPRRTIQRSEEGRMLTGVCAGLGRHTGMDPVLFRVGFAVLVIGSGIGIFLYIAAFLLMRGPDGRPGVIEQWARRSFDAQTVLALLAAVFALGLIINLASGGISVGTIAVATLLAIALLTAHSRGVDLLGVVKALPDHIMGRRGRLGTPTPTFDPHLYDTPRPGEALHEPPQPPAGTHNDAPPEAPSYARTPQDDPLHKDPTPNAAPYAAAPHAATLHESALHEGTAQEGTAQEGEAQEDAAQEGAAQEGALRDVPPLDGWSHDDTWREEPLPDARREEPPADAPGAVPGPAWDLPTGLEHEERPPADEHPADTPAGERPAPARPAVASPGQTSVTARFAAPAPEDDPGTTRFATPPVEDDPGTTRFAAPPAQDDPASAHSTTPTPEDDPDTARFATPAVEDGPASARLGARSGARFAEAPASASEVAGHDVPPADAPGSDGWEMGAPGGAGASDGPGGYRRLADLASEARAQGVYGGPGGSPGAGYSSGEPFAPHGPYDRPAAYGADPYLDGPYDLAEHRPAPATAAPRRRRSFIGLVTMLLALIIGGIMVAAHPGATAQSNLTLAGGAVLVTIGGGLLVAAWFGRGAGLVAAGTLVSLALVAGTAFNGLPTNVGSFSWAPVSAAQINRNYSVSIGDGKLDLSGTDVAPGSHTTIHASISLGELKVIVPPTARVDVYAYSRLGDVRVDHSTRSGPNVRFHKVLSPEVAGKGEPPTFELHLKANVGDVEVRRAA